MCVTENLVHRQKSLRDLNNDRIAAFMTGEGHKISGDQVQKIFAGNSGVTLDKLGSFLRSLGLKIVPVENPTISTEEHQALKLFASKYLGDTGTKAGE